MKLGGFALKKGKKKALETSAGFSTPISAAPQTSEKIFVTDFDPNALPEDRVKALVIPLLETNSWNTEPNEEKVGTLAVEMGNLSADQQAAAEILAESKAHSGDNVLQQELVIPVISEREKRRAELFQDGEKRLKKEQQKPILQQNAVPGLDELQDVTEKYRHDVALRPDAPDVHSDVYESVPVEAFGAALLRGMGWRGDMDLDNVGEAPQPRHKLLGLGATKRPGEDKKKRKKRKKTDTLDDDRRSGFKREDRKQSVDRDERHSRSRSQNRSDREKRNRSRSRDDRGRNHRRDRDRDRDRHRRSRSHSRSSRSNRRH
ncbi:hypothetical protein DD237_005183 [Peronospora effusa]|uniref:Spp2/MOS2 G-patch domain-containing protein n=1 Tax=Peronospora effusa TaxID=542832 RepID=A0A425C0F8_9STRA|nr:hypothetical protein DD237_005183 [Peronospora effusa]